MMKKKIKQSQLCQSKKMKAKYRVWVAELEYFLDTMTVEKRMRPLFPQKKMLTINSGIRIKKSDKRI